MTRPAFLHLSEKVNEKIKFPLVELFFANLPPYYASFCKLTRVSIRGAEGAHDSEQIHPGSSCQIGTAVS